MTFFLYDVTEFIVCFLQKAFDGNYSTFVRVIQKCLGEERLLIESCEADVRQRDDN